MFPTKKKFPIHLFFLLLTAWGYSYGALTSQQETTDFSPITINQNHHPNLSALSVPKKMLAPFRLNLTKKQRADLTRDRTSHYDDNGFTAFHRTCFNGFYAYCVLLNVPCPLYTQPVSKGPFKGLNVFHLAVGKRNYEILEFLVRKRPGFKNTKAGPGPFEGLTPFELALFIDDKISQRIITTNIREELKKTIRFPPLKNSNQLLR